MVAGKLSRLVYCVGGGLVMKLGLPAGKWATLSVDKKRRCRSKTQADLHIALLNMGGPEVDEVHKYHFSTQVWTVLTIEQHLGACMLRRPSQLVREWRRFMAVVCSSLLCTVTRAWIESLARFGVWEKRFFFLKVCVSHTCREYSK